MSLFHALHTTLKHVYFCLMAMRKELVLLELGNDFIVNYVLAEDEKEEDEAFDDYFGIVEYLFSKRYINKRQLIPKNFELLRIISELDPMRFSRYARTTPTLFNYLVELLSGCEVFSSAYVGGRHQLPIYLQILIALYRFGHNGNAASVVEVAAKFAVSDGGTITDCTKRVIQAICSLSSRFIKWPTHSERLQLAQEMAYKGLPNCIGFIDGSHFRLAYEPSKDGISYFNRKSFYSLNPAVVVNYKKQIIDFQLGFPGKVHDATVYKAMSLYKNPQQKLDDNQYIVGDPAYGLSKHMITPFRQTSLDTAEKKKYNAVVCNNRIVVEHAFGLLKKRFASLDGLRMQISNNKGNRYAWEWTWACFVLHSIFLDDGWDADENIDTTESDHLLVEEGIETNERQDKAEGIKRRNDLIYYINDVYSKKKLIIKIRKT